MAPDVIGAISRFDPDDECYGDVSPTVLLIVEIVLMMGAIGIRVPSPFVLLTALILRGRGRAEPAITERSARIRHGAQDCSQLSTDEG